MKIIYLEWEDAHDANLPWMTDEEIDKFTKQSNNYFIKCSGFLVRETKRYVVMATNITDGTLTTVPQYGHIIKIPKAWIRKRQILKSV